MADRAAHRLGGEMREAFFCGQLFCDRAISGGLSVRDGTEDLPYLTLKRSSQKVEGNLEVRLLSCKINVQPAPGRLEYGKFLFFCFFLKPQGEILLAFKPQAGKAAVVCGKEDLAKRRRVMAYVLLDYFLRLGA